MAELDELGSGDAASLLLEGVVDPGGRGLLPRGGTAPVRGATLVSDSVMGRTAEALLRLASVAEQAAELLKDHPDPEVRRACALLAARAHPLRVGLEVELPAR